MFLILIALIFMGNAFFMKSQVNSVVTTYAIRGASYCSDSFLETVRSGELPSYKTNIEPYSGIFGGKGDIESAIGAEVVKELRGNTSTAFSGMKAVIHTPSSEVASYNNKVLYATFSVQVDYSINLPIRIMSGEPLSIMDVSSRAEIAVNDAPEFIRNTDMILDLFHGTKVAKTVSDAFSKIHAFIEDFANK